MKSTRLLLVIFALGVAAGALARGSKNFDMSSYASKKPAEAGKAFLELARSQAGKGSWENIAVGRAYYLGGMKAEGRALFDQVTSKKAVDSDLIRIARVYNEAGEWSKAKEIYDKAVSLAPKDAAWLAEAGAAYNLHGDRAKAEELFKRSMDAEGGEVWHTVNIAGSYLGVKPQL
jgi:tetratricopeptide (TPR) repeat protein